MAQINGTTNELYKLTAALINGNGTYITCDKGTLATIAAFTATNNAPVSEETANGFGRQSGTHSIITTTVTNDTAQIYYLYTCNTNTTINGHEVMSAAANGNMLGYCSYNASQPMQVNDTLNAIMQFQVEIGA